MDKLTSPSRIERVSPNLAPYVHIALSATDPPEQFNTDNAVFKLMLLRKGIDIDNMGEDGSPVQFQGNTRVLDPSTSTPVVMAIAAQYDKLRNEYMTSYLNQPNKTVYTESKAREYLTQFDNFIFKSEEQLKQFLSIIDPAKNKFLKSWDAFKVNNQTVTVKETGYYDEL